MSLRYPRFYRRRYPYGYGTGTDPADHGGRKGKLYIGAGCGDYDRGQSGYSLYNKLPVYHDCGINRVSIGLQSADNQELKTWAGFILLRSFKELSERKNVWLYQYKRGSYERDPWPDA